MLNINIENINVVKSKYLDLNIKLKNTHFLIFENTQKHRLLTPFSIEDAQYATPSSLITATRMEKCEFHKARQAINYIKQSLI